MSGDSFCVGKPFIVELGDMISVRELSLIKGVVATEGDELAPVVWNFIVIRMDCLKEVVIDKMILRCN